MNRILLAAGLLAASTGLAVAHDTTAIERELSLQARMIDDGRRDGSLIPQEVRMLKDEQARIEWMLVEARYDGVVTRREVKAITEAQALARQAIASELADSDVSHWRRRYADRYDYGYGRPRFDWFRRYERGYGDREWDGYGRWGSGYGRDRGAY